MSSFSKELQQRLQEIGAQGLADDPKVVAVIESPSKELTFYITEYSTEKEQFSGYMKGEGIADWVFLATEAITKLDEMPAKARRYALLKEAPRISQLVPETKNSIAMARYHKRIQKEYEKKRNQSKSLELER